MDIIGPVRFKKRFGFLSENGDWAVPPVFEYLGKLEDGRAPFLQDGLLGFIDNKGQPVIPPRFSVSIGSGALWGFHEGIAPIHTGGFTRYIQRDGSVFLELSEGIQGWHFLQGYAMTLDSIGNYKATDTVGRLGGVLPIYDAPFLPRWPRDWNCFACWGRAPHALVGCLNRLGEIIFPFTFAQLSDFCDGVATFALPEKPDLYGLIRSNGQIISTPVFRGIGEFRDGLAPAISESGRTGFIDSRGNWAIPPRYGAALPFSGGLAAVTIRRKTGFINRKGDMIIDPRFDEQTSFQDGYAEVRIGSLRQIINSRGESIWHTCEE